VFCYQCQETSGNEACTKKGVCGKTGEVASLQDLLVWLTKGISFYGVHGREYGVRDAKADLFVVESLFSTITNANFDPAWFVSRIQTALSLRDGLATRFEAAVRDAEDKPFTAPRPDAATWTPANIDLDEFVAKGSSVGVMADPELNEDIRSLRELLVYGVKGYAAYIDHARVLDHEQEELSTYPQEALLATLDPDLTVPDLVAMVLRCGEMGVKGMALLDEANTATYGNPEPTQVDLGVREGPAILVSGHDLRDLADLLRQTEGKGVNVYTHGEMLPGHAYPAFKKYSHFVGNYGDAWWNQKNDFEDFGGAVLMTTNCIVKPRPSYHDRIFTTGLVGWPGVTHIEDRTGDGEKDFGPVIRKALESGSPKEIETGRIPVGFAHHAVLSLADKVIDAVKSGAVKRFVVMAGCDGRQGERSYYTDVARQLPDDSIILTAGCAKYRYNKLDLGDIGGIPRVLDAGQCNDSYSLVVIAQALAKAFDLEDINDLPISYDIGWYEQKAVIVLLALLSLGVKHIRLGPTLPAFLSPNVLSVLVESFDVKPIGTVEQDLAAIVAGN